jgi:hypothetical protein
MFASFAITRTIHQLACDQWLVMFADGGSVVVNAQGRVVASYLPST